MPDWQQVAADDPLAAVGPMMARYGVRASLAVPILLEGRRIGGLCLAAPSPRPWSAEEVALAESAGQQIGGIAEGLRLLAQVREQARQMQQIVNTVSEGVLWLNAENEIILANPVAREYLAALSGADVGDTLTYLGELPLAELLIASEINVHKN